jgi:arylformamidase
MKHIDVTVPLDARLPTYPNNTPFSLEPIKRVSRGASNVSTLHMSAHTGTHVDASRHCFDDGTGTEALSLDLIVGRARVIEAASREGIWAPARVVVSRA